ncbi:MAG TPA: CHASE domain-containing protein, partial [Phormidium sp.]
MALSEKRRYTPVWLMLSVGTLLSIAAFFSVAKWESKTHRTEFKNQADKLATALQQSIDTNLGMLRATGSLYAASENVTRQEFSIFVKDFLVNYPSILAFNWSRRVTAQERKVYEQLIGAEGYSNFEIRERGTQGEPLRAGERPEYFPITYIEALESQSGALGYDLLSDPLRRIALQKARDTGKLIATARIKIITSNKLGFLTFKPIYRKNTNLNSIESRRQNFQGVTTAAFQIYDIV